MQLEPRGIFSLMGLQLGTTFPVVVDCPVCGANSKLEIRSTHHIYCRECHFAGDAVELLARYRQEDLRDTMTDLVGRGFMAYAEGADLKYLADRRRQRAIKDMVDAGGQILMNGVPGSVYAILTSIGARFSEKPIQAMVPHLVFLRRDDLEKYEITTPGYAREALKWWAKYSALAAPVWDGPDIVGLYLMTTKGVCYLPLRDSEVVGAAFARVPSLTDSAVFVVEDLPTAVRFSMWSVVDTGRPYGFVVPVGLRDRPGDYACARTVYLSATDSPQWFMRAGHTSGARVLCTSTVPGYGQDDRYPCKGSFAQFLDCARDAQPAHQAVAYRLLELDRDTAAAEVTAAGLDAQERARVLSYVKDHDADFLSSVFDTGGLDTRVEWDGRVITDTRRGWVVDGKLISTAKIHVSSVRPCKDGDAILNGYVVYRDESYQFRTNLSSIQPNPGKWLQKFVMVQCGGMVHIETQWGKRLIEIAQLFHAPVVLRDTDGYGWSGSELRMPNFVVNDHGIYPSQSYAEGPALLPPEPLAESEWDAFNTTAFCRVVLALVANLVRTSRGEMAVGILLKNEPHLIDRMAEAFGVRPVVNPTQEALDANALAPLPLFSHWTTNDISQLFGAEYRHVVLSVDSHTDRLTRLFSGWLHLEVGTAIDYRALRAIFLLLPGVLRCQDLNPASKTFYRDLADRLKSEVDAYRPGNKLATAGMHLDTYNVCTGDTAATRIVELVLYEAEAGSIVPQVQEDAVVVDVQQFVAATASSTVVLPPVAELTDRLVEARFLVGRPSPGHWRFSRALWDMNVALLS